VTLHIYHRRRTDPPIVPAEGPVEHLRNALAIARLVMDTGAPVFGSGNDSPGVVVRIHDLARLQARLEAAIEQLTNGDRTL
jgi:hypothetical protein